MFFEIVCFVWVGVVVEMSGVFLVDVDWVVVK